MNYLFFDCEGANSFNFISKMCTFGYVITDDKFHIKSKIDVVMNPQSKFQKAILDLHMNAYPLQKYECSPTFDYFYDSIAKIFTDGEKIIVGWSADNDVRYIIDACTRYKKSQIKFTYLDIQLVYQKYKKLYNLSSLESACNEENISVLTSHKSDDDAHMTMLICKEICNNLNMSLSEIVIKFPECVFSVDDIHQNMPSPKDKYKKMSANNFKNHVKNAKKNPGKRIRLIKDEDIVVFTQKTREHYGKRVKDILSGVINSCSEVTYDYSKATVIICFTNEDKTEMIRKNKFSDKRILCLDDLRKNKV